MSGNFFAQISLQKSANTFEKLDMNQFASISISIIDLDTDSVLANINGKKTLMCASTAKLFSTFSALEILGANYKPETRFYMDGFIDSLGILQGDLYIRGGGDVSLGSKYFNEEGSELDFMHVWMDALRSVGLHGVNGDLIVDGSEFGYAGVPDGWDWSDMGNYYGAGASGINFYDNTVKYNFQTFGAGQKAKFLGTFPLDSDLTFRHTIKSANIRNDQSYLYGAPYSQDRFGVGSLPSNRKEFIVKGSMHDPESMLAKEFSDLLKDSTFYVLGQSKGFRLSAIAHVEYDSLNILYTYKGERIQDIVGLTNLNSINLFAEGLLNLIGFKEKGMGSTNSGIKAVYEHLENKIDISGMKLKDGSGLSRKNAVSAQNFCALLSYINQSKLNKSFRSSLAIAGKSGTLSNICRSQMASGRVFAKSGTLSNVKAYAGYVNTLSGKNLAFAMIVNNFSGSRYKLVKQMELVFNAMASY